MNPFTSPLRVTVNNRLIEKRFARCIFCMELKHIFLKDLNVCASCARIVPSYIPEEQVERYLEVKAEEI